MATANRGIGCAITRSAGAERPAGLFPLLYSHEHGSPKTPVTSCFAPTGIYLMGTEPARRPFPAEIRGIRSQLPNPRRKQASTQAQESRSSALPSWNLTAPNAPTTGMADHRAILNHRVATNSLAPQIDDSQPLRGSRRDP